MRTKLQLLELRKQALKLRAAGLDVDAIAGRLLVPFEHVTEMLGDARPEVQTDSGLAALEDAQLHAMMLGLWPKAVRGDKQAIDALVRLMDRRRQLPRELDRLTHYKARLREAIDIHGPNLKRTGKLCTNPEIGERIFDSLAAGNFRTTACAASGIKPHTLHEWMDRGQAGEAPYATFADAVVQIEAVAEEKHLRAIVQSDDWQAHKWILSRKYPKRWGDHATQIEVTGKEGSPLINPNAHDELLARIAGIAARQAKASGNSEDSTESEPRGSDPTSS